MLGIVLCLLDVMHTIKYDETYMEIVRQSTLILDYDIIIVDQTRSTKDLILL